MYQKVKVEVHRCVCELCHYEWVSLAVTKPESCRNRDCRSREWDGKSKPSYVNEIKLPSPRRQGRPRSSGLIDVRER